MIAKISSRVLDVLFILSLIVALSGGSFLFSDSFRTLIQQKPWIHRLVVLIPTMFLFGFVLYEARLAKQKSFFFTAIERYKINSNRHWGLCILLFSFSALQGILLSTTRHQVFQTAFDMAIFNQAVWTTLQGDILYSSIKGGICLLGDHFSPFLLTLVPFYGMAPKPETLLVLQALAVSSTVFPLFLLARDQLKEKKWGVLIAFCFTFYLPVRKAVCFEFHPELFAIPFFVWAFYFFERGKLGLSSVFLILILSTKESAALATLGFGLLALCRKSTRFFGFSWAFLSVAYLLITIKWIIPLFSKQEYFYLSGNFLAWKEQGISSLAAQILSKASVVYVLKILLPVVFLPFFSWEAILLTLPSFVQNLTARNDAVRSIFFHYTAFLTPAVFVGTILGLKKLKRYREICAWALVFFTMAMSGVPDFHAFLDMKRQDQSYFKEWHAFLKSIPSEISVRTNESLASHLGHRKQLHIYENQNPSEGASSAAQSSQMIVISDLFMDLNHKQRELIQSLGYIKTKNISGLEVFERKNV